MEACAPPAHVLAAFGAVGVPVVEPGGQGRTWRVGDRIVKPCDNAAAAAWTAAALPTLAASARFRVPLPVPSRAGNWVESGWQAWQAVSGQPDVTRWDEVLDLSDAVHRALAGLPRPAFLDTRDDPWSYGDRVAWQELPVNPRAVMADLLLRLARARRPIDLPAQLVHGDLLGNVLFAPGQPPAVIDWSCYYRPALWAQAVAVVDALTWHGAPAELAGRHAARDGWGQLLIRALMYRIATNEGGARQGRPGPERPQDYQPVVDLVLRQPS
jgi:uncharacterized protein (TIGR02569 family)